MLDLKRIRLEPDLVRERLAVRGDDGAAGQISRIIELDDARRALIGEGDALKAQRNTVSQQIGEQKRQGEDTSEQLAGMREVSDQIRGLDGRLRAIEAEIEDLLLRTPNLPDAAVPRGGEAENQLLREWGEPRHFDFHPRPHWEIAAELGLVDLPAGAKVAGSGFPVFTGMGARLERGLINWMLDLHTREHGYTEISPPFLVNAAAMTGTGQFPKFIEEGDAYQIEQDELYLIPTAEVPVTNMHREELLDAGRLPITYVAYSPCFRREAGSAGKDTRGLLRLHQFDKVELVRFERTEDSDAAHEALTTHAETILQQLGLPYRTLLLSGGEMGFSNRKQYDIEVWAPGVDRWLEVSSCSNFGDYQARRASIRYRPASGGKPEFVHTLNGSALALPRTVVALLENGQQADGSVRIPPVLEPYLGTALLTP